MKACYFCQETDELEDWVHPETGLRLFFCGDCFRTIVGLCAECGNILSRLDPIGVNAEGQRICYKCSAVHDMAEDDI